MNVGRLRLIVPLILLIGLVYFPSVEATHFSSPMEWGGSTTFGPYPTTVLLSQDFDVVVHAQWHGLEFLCVGGSGVCISQISMNIYISDDSGYTTPGLPLSCGAIVGLQCSPWFQTDSCYGQPIFMRGCAVNYPPTTGQEDVTFHVISILGTPGYQWRAPPMSKTPTMLRLIISMSTVINEHEYGMGGDIAIIQVTNPTQISTSTSLTTSVPAPTYAEQTATTPLMETPSYETYGGWIVAAVLALALVAVIGYQFGNRQRKRKL